MASTSLVGLLYQQILTTIKRRTVPAPTNSSILPGGNASEEATKRGLEGLPLDIRVLIASFVSRRKDTKSLMLSCRSLYGASIPRFYRLVTFLPDFDTDHLVAMLNPDNQGLQHIRHVEVEPELSGESPTELLHLLAHLLPKDILVTFSLDCSATADSKNTLQTLHRRQRSLRTARVSGAVLRADCVLHAGGLQNITLLHVHVHCSVTKPGHELLKSLPALKHLEIRVELHQYCVATNHDYNTASERGNASEEIFVAVFGRKFVDGCEAVAASKLRSLSLYDLDLTKSSRLLEAVDLSRLHSLVLQRCENITKLLAGVKPTGLPSRMSLTNLVLVAPEQWHVDRPKDDESIDDFLKSFQGLESLTIHGLNDETIRPSCEAVAAHQDTLRLLFLSCHWSDERPANHHYDADMLQKCLSQCTQLEQLAIQAPAILLEREAESVRQYHGEFAAALSAAPILRTLRILSSPDHSHLQFDVPDTQLSHTWMNTKLQLYATEYLTQSPKTNTISIGSKEYEFGDVTYLTSYYTRGKMTDAYGVTKTVAIEMETKYKAQDIEPVSDIYNIEPLDGGLLRYGYKHLV
ncbi:hypothetical protein LTR56_000810 [Elasticomyces elasticus]|nr:hypothetical protein LTR22_009033 [Elasticomyces elasticus]KAK3660434.1 hypothetical protein LTR56_000810 [Elasticomyces elasticus]KAK4929173.1 hypothetical protein LTR49_004070 [Elasticomyces elasticus]KAK5765729.1 hypothetical protein LTS12_003989 [Elasticomyces elasticus]